MSKMMSGLILALLLNSTGIIAQSNNRAEVVSTELNDGQESKKITKDEKKQLKGEEKEAKNLAAEQEELRIAAERTALRKDVLGYWWMYDLFAKEPSGMMYLYEYKGKVYGRTVFSYVDEKDKTQIDSHNKPLAKSEYIKEEPYLMGMDMMWQLTWDDRKLRYNRGFVLDPRKKKPYLSEIWGKEDGLNMKGIVMIMGIKFGGSVIWTRATEADLPKGVEPMGKNLVPKLYYMAD